MKINSNNNSENHPILKELDKNVSIIINIINSYFLSIKDQTFSILFNDLKSELFVYMFI